MKPSLTLHFSQLAAHGFQGRMCFSRATERTRSKTLGKRGGTGNRWACFKIHTDVQDSSAYELFPLWHRDKLQMSLKKQRRVAGRQKRQEKLTAGSVSKTVPPPVGWFLGTSGKAHGRVIMFPKPREGNYIVSCVHPPNKLHLILGETNWDPGIGKMTEMQKRGEQCSACNS